MSGTSTGATPRVLALLADLFFTARVRASAQAAGVAVRTVRTGDELLRKAKAAPPALVILDLGARNEDVPALIGALKGEPATAAATVIAFGAHVDDAALRAARSAGADRVLARSGFVRELPDLLRHAGPAGPAGSGP